MAEQEAAAEAVSIQDHCAHLAQATAQVNALKVQLNHTKDPEQRQERMLRITEILEGAAKDKPGALDVAMQAFAETPDSAWAQEWIERLSPEVGNWEQIAQVYEDGVSVTCVSPSLIVPTPGVVHHRLITKQNQDEVEPPEITARATLLLATEPREKVSGRVTYSQQILKEFGWIDQAQGTGVGEGRSGSGYSQI